MKINYKNILILFFLIFNIFGMEEKGEELSTFDKLSKESTKNGEFDFKLYVEKTKEIFNKLDLEKKQEEKDFKEKKEKIKFFHLMIVEKNEDFKKTKEFEDFEKVKNRKELDEYIEEYGINLKQIELFKNNNNAQNLIKDLMVNLEKINLDSEFNPENFLELLFNNFKNNLGNLNK